MPDETKEIIQAIRRHTNNQKNCCGCLLLILTAPFWFPMALYLIGLAQPDYPERDTTPRHQEEEAEPISQPAPQTFTTAPATAVPQAPGLAPNAIVYTDPLAYHTQKDCPNRTQNDGAAMTAAKAQERGLQPCPNCIQ